MKVEDSYVDAFLRVIQRYQIFVTHHLYRLLSPCSSDHGVCLQMLGLQILHLFARLIKVVAEAHGGASGEIRVNLIQLVIRILLVAADGRLFPRNLKVWVGGLHHCVCDLSSVGLGKPYELLIVTRLLLERGDADCGRALLLIGELVSVDVWGLIIEFGHLSRVEGWAGHSVCLDWMPQILLQRRVVLVALGSRLSDRGHCLLRLF